MQEHPEENQDLSSLYLPAICPHGNSVEGSILPVVLKKAAELLFDDAPYYNDRIRSFDQLFVVDLKRANVRCSNGKNYKDLIMFLPSAVRPQMLSCAVKEKFADSRDNTEYFDIGAASSLKKRLHSEQLLSWNCQAHSSRKSRMSGKGKRKCAGFYGKQVAKYRDPWNE